MPHPNVSPAYPNDWIQRRKRVYQRDGYKCQSCGSLGGNKGDHEVHAHHIVPISDGGKHHLSNLITLCETCHKKVHTVISNQTGRRVSNTNCVENKEYRLVENHKCQNCHETRRTKNYIEFQTHIILSESDGGVYSESNLATLCRECHECIHEFRSKQEISADRKMSATICVECGGDAPSVGEERCRRCRQWPSEPDNTNGVDGGSKTTDNHVTNQSETSTLSPLAGFLILILLLLFLQYIL
ncbi:HNH endonuclease [Halorubrum ezzemoulense]|uniref:HNH endonuclease n=1 Tax=Halorubrum ezzemoulense TaxID=337243 RepID=UPI003CCE5689